MTANDQKIVVVLATGGTIAGTAASADDSIGYRAAQLGVDDLLKAAAVPVGNGIEVMGEEVAQVDSKDMDFAVWQRLLRRTSHWLSRPDVRSVVVTHGTDTLEETAWFLHLALDAQILRAKPVVFTCAMRPATSSAADGPQNLRDAIAVATDPGARGVMAVCAGVVHGATDVQKAHTYRLDAFDSGDAGPLGYVEDGGLRKVRAWPDPPKVRVWATAEAIASTGRWPRVEIIMNHAGTDGAIVPALLAHGERSCNPVLGVVVSGTGNGSLHHTLEMELLKARASGLQVVRATRCARGRVIPVPGQAIPDSDGQSPVKARVSMLLRLM